MLEEAKVLDTRIKERKEQKNKAGEDVRITKETYRQTEQQLKEKQQKANELKEIIEELTRWKENNVSRQPIADNQKLIISKLSDARGLLDDLQNISTQTESTENTLKGKKKEKEELVVQSAIFKPNCNLHSRYIIKSSRN